MQATHRAELNLRPLLSTRSKTAHIFPHLQEGALIYIGRLCYYGCITTLTATQITVDKKGDIFLEFTHKGVADM